LINYPDPVRWPAVSTALITLTLAMLPGFLGGALAVQIRADIGLSLSGLGAVLGVFFGTAAVASAPAGRLAQRVGWERGIQLAATVAAVTLAGVALVARSLPSTLAVFAVGGIGAALAQPSADLTIARCAPPHRHGFMFGLKHAAVPAATLLGGIAVPTVALTVGWRWAFVIGAVAAGAVALSAPMVTAGTQTGPATVTDAPGARPTTHLRLLIILAAAVGLGIGATDAMAAFLVSYSVDIGIGEAAAGLMLTVGSGAGMITRLAAGWVIDRHRSADLAAVATMLGLATLGTVIIATGGRAALLIGGLIGFAAGWGWSGLFTFAVVRANPDAPAAASGITQSGKFLGAALGPAAFGVIADRISFTTAWWTTAIALGVAGMIIVYVKGRLTAQTQPA